MLIGVADLAAAALELEAHCGLASVEGGRHPGWGTANRIVPLGARLGAGQGRAGRDDPPAADPPSAYYCMALRQSVSKLRALDSDLALNRAEG